MHHIISYFAAHLDAWKLVAQFLGGLAAAFGAVVGAVIAWRKLVLERKQEDFRVVRPTMEEIEKYGQPIRSRETERKIGGVLTLIIGAAYTYIMLRYMRWASAPALPLTATIILNAAGILALAQGIFHPFGQMSISLWHRLVWTAAGVAGISAGTYIGVDATTLSTERREVKEKVTSEFVPDTYSFSKGLILWTPYKRFPHEQAVQSYERALELNPNLDEAQHQLGFVYLHIGLLDKGWQEIEKALAINPGNSLARYRLGVIDMCRGKYEEAFQIFNSTPLEKSPSLLAF